MGHTLGVMAIMMAWLLAMPEGGYAQIESSETPTIAAHVISDLGVARDAIASRNAYPFPEAVIEALYESLLEKGRTARTRADHLRIMEAFVFGLGDHHVHLGTNDQDSPRLVPSGSSVWVETRGEDLVVTQVRVGSAARQAGLREGMLVDSINGVSSLAMKFPSVGEVGAMRGFAARVALAGTHRQDAEIEASGKDGKRTKVLLSETMQRHDEPVTLRWPKPKVAWIRIHNQLGQSELIPAFDKIMDDAMEAESILLDLRDTPSGGDSIIAKPIMSWFVKGKKGYQVHERGEKRWTEMIAGRAAGTFRGRLVVLADHWTGSMGEGMTIGLRAAANATYVGTKMAGLRGAMAEVNLPGLQAPLRFPVERLFEVNGNPRELAVPDILVTEEELAAGRDDEDVILRRALEVLR